MGPFFEDNELSEEEVDEIILETAKRIHRYNMEMVAIMTLESLKPLAYIGGELTRLTLTPFLPILGPEVDRTGENLINVFEERRNIDKLIDLLEKISRGEMPVDEEDESEDQE
jgi:hypothetical protein